MIPLPLLSPGIAMWMLASLCAQQQIVQPARYGSASGEWQLTIEPSQRYGRGPASYRMFHRDELEWARELALTFVDARIAADGTAAGFAYVNDRGKDLELAILAPDGNVRHLELIERKGLVVDAPAEPLVSGVWLSSAEDRVVFELEYARNSRHLLPFRLSTGEGLKADSLRMPSEDPEHVPRTLLGDAPPPVGPTRELALELLGSVRFEGFDASDSVKRPHLRHVDARGRIWISELGTGVVRSYDAQGKLGLVCTPSAGADRPSQPYGWIGVRVDGQLFGQSQGKLVEFDSKGRFVACTPCDRAFTGIWLFLPEGDAHWALDRSGIELVGPLGPLRTRVERAANGRWLRDLTLAAMASDGALAVVDDAGLLFDGDLNAYVQRLAPDGAALGALAVPAECHPLALAFDGSAVILLGRRELWFLAEGGDSAHARLPDAVGEVRELYLSPDGTELWLFTRPDAVLVRCANPLR